MRRRSSGNRDYIIVVCAVVSALVYTPGFLVSQAFMPVLLAGIGLATGYMCGTMWAMVPRVMSSPAYIGLGMSVIALMQGLSNFLSTPLLGYFIAGNHWTGGVVPIAVAQILGVICAAALAGIKGKDRLPAKAEAVQSA
jgi:MFS family permease